MSILHYPNDENLVSNDIDIEHSKPVKSRFLFLLIFFCLFIFSWAGCYRLSETSFEANSDVPVPSSSLYAPKYK